MKRPLIALVAVLLAALGSTAWFAQAADEKPIANLATYGDDTDVVRGGLAITLSPALPLFSGDVVQTRKGEAVVAFTDGTRIRLKPRTRIEVTESGNRRSVDVLFGRLWSFIARKQGVTTGFKTGGTIAAVRGTKIEYRANEDGSVDVGVIEGSLVITFTNLDGTTSSVTLGKGEFLHIPPRGAPGPPQKFTPGDIVGGETADLGPEGSRDIQTRLVRVTARSGNDPFSGENPTTDSSGPLPTPTPGSTPGLTPTPTPRETPGGTPTPPAATPTPTATPRATPQNTPGPPAATPTRTATPTATPTATATPTSTPRATPHPTRPTSPTPKPSGRPSGTPFPTGSQGGSFRLGLADFRGTYEGMFRPRIDKADLERKLGLSNGPVVLQVRMNGPSLTLSGPAPFVAVTGTLDGQSVILTGSGTVQGTPGVRAEFIGRFDSSARGARLSGVYVLGLGGTLPGGANVSYNFEGRQ